MKNKKGFTLVEVLVVVVIIGIILLIAVPAVSSYMKRGTDEYYSSLEETVMLSGRDYLNDYRALLPKEIGNVTVIELDELTTNKYIDEVVDSNGNKCQAKVTAKKVGKNEYEYYSCLICDDYDPNGEDEECLYNEDYNITSDTKNYRVEVDKTGNYEIDADGVYIVDQGEDFDLPYGIAYYKKDDKETVVNNKVIGNPKTINTNKLGTTTVIYAYKGAKAEIKVKVVDRVKPNAPQVVLRYDDKDGKIYKGGWYSGDIYAEFKSTDYSIAGVTGSGIARYEISNDGKTYTALDSNNYLNTENGEKQYYVKSVDKSGNESDSNTYSFKIDKEIPECELEVKSGTKGSNEWYTSNVTVGFKSKTDKISGIFDDTISHTSITSNTTGTTVKATVTDLAGNVGACSLVVKIDKQIPSLALTISDSITSGNWHKANFTITSSGANNISGNTYYYGNTSNPTTNETETGSSVPVSSNTAGTTYYLRLCSGAGLCDEESYVAKLDKTTPDFTVVASDKIASGSWHKANFTITSSGANNISGNTYYHGTATTPTTNSNSTGSSQSVTTNSTSTSGTIYYFRVCSGSGICKVKSYTAKLDKTVPTIAAKSSSNYITASTGAAITGYFNITTGISSGTTVCKLGTKTVTNTNNLALGVNTVTCTTTSGSGLSASASTTFRHQYTATAYCNGSRTLSGGNCTYYYDKNEGQCGCATYKTCATSGCGVSQYKSCENSACGAKSCATSACGVASYNTCENSACGISSYKTCQNSACGTDTIECSGTTTGSCVSSAQSKGYSCSVTGNISYYTKCTKTKSCATSGCGVKSYKSCAHSNCGVASYKTCQNSACGYNSCRTSGCGVESYKSCENSACGCQTGASCTKIENSYRYYKCEQTGNTGGVGTLSGSTCSF